MTEPEQPTSPDDLDDSELDPRALAALQKARREAANLRTRLHESEADREKLLTQNAALQHREVERIAGETLVDAQDIWRHAEDQDFVDAEFAEVIPDKVRDAVAAIVEQRPHLGKPPSAPPPSARPIEHLRGGASPEVKPKSITWSSAIRGR